MTEDKFTWLVRDSSNNIRGPYSQNELLQQIKKGHLKAKTEVSRANSYWFSMEEKIEVAKFFPELGLKTPEKATQMTATLTSADVSDHLEATQFTPAAKVPEKEGEGGEIEWLSDEFADEFGTDEPIDLLKKTSVRDEMHPSEHKDQRGPAPRPFSAPFKGPERASGGSTMVQVPVEKQQAPGKIIDYNARENSGGGKKIGLIVVLLLAAAGAGAFFLARGKHKNSLSVLPSRSARGSLNTEQAMKRALIFFDLEGAREIAADMEADPKYKGNIALPLSQAMIKKEFLYDAEGALTSLQAARALATDKSAVAETENLLATYRFERDRNESLTQLRNLITTNPQEIMFRYNYALELMRSDQAKESIAVLTSFIGAIPRNDSLAKDAYLLLGWAKDVTGKGIDPAAEAAYLKALENNNFAPKARLGLAIHRLRKAGLRESEMDFRAFLEAMPELDPPTEVTNFRKMGDSEFYSYARAQLRDLNIPLGAAGTKPSPLIMAVDAVLSCLQSRTGEAGKILENALSSAPGDANVLKAVGFLRWKEGRYADVVDLLKDLSKDRNSFAINLLMGKSFLKTGRRDLAERYFENLTVSAPMRSDGWSLLGGLQLELGKTAEAQKNLTIALQRNGEDILALRGLDRLGEPKVVSPELAKNLPF